MNSPFRDSLFAGKTAVITGGGSGINQRIAERLAEQGARVALIGRTKEKLDKSAASITAAGGQAQGFPADVRDYAALEAAMQQAAQAFGPLDILVCGAAGNFPAPALGMSANAFKSVMDIDALGTFNTCRSAFQHLRRPGASIVNISAPQSFVPMAYQSHVCAAKAAVDMITRTLAIEWGPQGVRVNSVVPGAIDDTEGMKRLGGNATSRAALEQAIPLKRMGARDDIADMVLFLCTPAASYVTGTVMICDGGMSLLGSGPWMQAMAAVLAETKK